MYDLFYVHGSHGFDQTSLAKFKERNPHVKTVSYTPDVMLRCARESCTSMFWLISSEINVYNDFDFSFSPPSWDRRYIHLWPVDGAVDEITSLKNGILGAGLYPTSLVMEFNGELSEIVSGSDTLKIMDEAAGSVRPYDIFFVSDESEERDQSWEEFCLRFPNSIRIQSTTKTLEECASRATGGMFWVVNSNVVPDQSWDFSYRPLAWDCRYIHLWPINGIPIDEIWSSYGLKGVGLYPTKLVSDFQSDLSTLFSSLDSLKIMDDAIGSVRPYDIFFVSDPSSGDDRGWDEFSSRFPNAARIQNTPASLEDCASRATGGMFWVVNSDVILDQGWDLSYRPFSWDCRYIHLWPINGIPIDEIWSSRGIDGVGLYPTKLVSDFQSDLSTLFSSSDSLKIMDDAIGSVRPYDIFFVSYEEPNADLNWSALISRFPSAKRVHGIKGIANAHKECARLATGEMFWTVDGDTVIDQDWDFSYRPPKWDRRYLHLWYSRNGANGLCYGYGAVKLWPTIRVRDHNTTWIDFTTSVGDIKIMEHPVATTVFNTSPFESWKSAFRECVKLCNNLKKNPDDLESKERMAGWTAVPPEDVSFSRWCHLGACDGITWYLSIADDLELDLINDFDWLSKKFSMIYNGISGSKEGKE